MPTVVDSDREDETMASSHILEDVLTVPIIDNVQQSDDENDDDENDDDENEQDHSSDDDDDNNEQEDIVTMFQQDDTLDYSHLADDYTGPLFTYPSSDPSTTIKAAYKSQQASRAKYDAARKSRQEFEVNVMAEKLGKLHNLLRESKERESKVIKTLRDKSISVYEMELTESNFEFNEWMGKLKVFVKKYKGLPPSLEELEKVENGDGGGDSKYQNSDYQERASDLALWLRDQHYKAAQSPSMLAPHQLASLENIGVIFSLSEDDVWHRSLYQFQLYSKEYWDNPILVQSTNGDLVRSIVEGYTTDEERKALQNWCQAQQIQYQQDGFNSNMDRYAKLVNAGFTFDVLVDENEWDEHLKLVNQFRTKFGHVHIPSDYTPPTNSILEEDSVSNENNNNKTTASFKLQDFITKVRTLIQRDALSPKRLTNLKNVSLYMSMGGRVHNYHVEHCQLKRTERGEPQRTKRKFVALAFFEEQGQGQKLVRKPKIIRGSMENWNFKLEKLVACKNKHGSIINIQNDVKLQGWVFSTIRKLSINSTALHGKKMELIESHEGLKEFLLRKENLEAAVEYAKARKDELDAKGGGGGGPKEEEKDDLGDLAEDVLLGKKEDHELNAFMEYKTEPAL